MDYFRDPYFLSYDLLYQKNSDNQFEKCNDTAVLNEMKRELAFMSEISRYAIESNTLIPGGLFVKEELTVKDILPSQQGYFHKITVDNEFIRIMEPIRMDENFQDLDINIQTKAKTSRKDTISYPPVIVEIVDTNAKKYLYSSMLWDMLAQSPPMEPGWQYLTIKRGIDLGFLHESRNKIIKLYIWNKERISLTLDSMTIHVRGFYDSSQQEK